MRAEGVLFVREEELGTLYHQRLLIGSYMFYNFELYQQPLVFKLGDQPNSMHPYSLGVQQAQEQL